MMNPEYFPDRLRELREAAGLTQRQLADQIGVKREAVARWEKGGNEPGWTYILALADALKVDCLAFTSKPTTTAQRGPGRPSRPNSAAAEGMPSVRVAKKPAKPRKPKKP